MHKHRNTVGWVSAQRVTQQTEIVGWGFPHH